MSGPGPSPGLGHCVVFLGKTQLVFTPLSESGTMIKISHSLLSLFLGSRSAEYLPCQVLFENSNGKSGYFDLVSWFWPSAIARLKNNRVYQKRVGTSQAEKK